MLVGGFNFGNIFSSLIEIINMFSSGKDCVIKKFLFLKAHFSEFCASKMKVEVEMQSSFKTEHNFYHKIS